MHAKQYMEVRVLRWKTDKQLYEIKEGGGGGGEQVDEPKLNESF